MTSIVQQLPEGWAQSSLKDILEIKYGKGLTKEKRIKGNYPVYGSNGIVGYHNQAITQSKTIIVGRKGTVGAIHYSYSACWPIDTTFFIDKFFGLNPLYLTYVLQYLDLPRLESSTTIPGLNRDDIYNQFLPLAPRLEQDRIVTKVEELLSGVAKAKERLEKVPAILDNFKKEVLSAACSGKLTEDWRKKHPNIERATRLLRQVKDRLGIVDDKNDSIDLDLELPEKWVSARISEFTTKVGSGSTPRGGKSSYKAEGIPLIRSLNVHFDGFRDEGLAYIDEKQAKSLDAVTVEIGDVLLNITGASIGRVTQVPPHMKGARVNQHVCIIRPCEVVNPTWLSYFLASPLMQDHIMKIQYGVTRQALTKELILNLTVPIPPIEEQEEIVNRIKSLFGLVNEVQERYQRISGIINKLPQAILSKAFSGELVPTEAAIAQKESRDYETAEQLLAKIKAEREKQHKQKRKVRKTMKKKTTTKKRLVFEVGKNRVLNVILKTKGKKLPPEQLFKMAGFEESSIDNFYEELRAAVQAGQIRELRPKKTEIYLEAVKR